MDSTRISLVLRLRNAGDVASWNEFSELYGPALFRVALKRGLQAADAENLVQEVMLSVAQTIDTWLEKDRRGSFRAWLLTIARNESIKIITRRSTRSTSPGGGEHEAMLHATVDQDSLSSEIDWEYRRSVFQWAAEQVQESVNEVTWRAFWLTSVEGCSLDYAAKSLGIGLGQVYCARSRVMSKIKEMVKRYEAP